MNGIFEIRCTYFTVKLIVGIYYYRRGSSSGGEFLGMGDAGQ
jgi:hypothetical protein